MTTNAWIRGVMKKTIFHLLPLLIVLFASGCSTVEKSERYSDVPLDSLKTAYIVLIPKANWDIEMGIREALAGRGVQVSAGILQDKPSDVAFYVTYRDQQKWDITMYLHSLEIQFLEGATGKLIASGSFKNSFAHTYPNFRQKAFEVVESMYQAK